MSGRAAAAPTLDVAGWLNWAGNHRISAGRLHVPRSVEEAQEVVARSPRIRALGTRHSFNEIVDSDGDLIAMTDIPVDVQVDTASRTASVSAGTTYGAAARALEAEGWALHNMGSLPHISIAGALATGTHGSGNRNGILATAARGLELIGPDGELHRVAADDDPFAGSVVALGALGVVSRVELALEPSYRLAQHVYRNVPWAAVLEDFEGVTGAAYSVSILTDWSGDRIEQVWTKSRTDEPDAQPEALRRFPPSAPDPNPALTDMTGAPGPWSERLPHFRLDATPSTGSEIQTEYFIDRRLAPQALVELRAMAELLRDVLIISELRTTAADELWMSPSYRRASLGIHFTWRNEIERVRPLIARIERVLAPFDPRPHWGKAFRRPDQPLGPRYDRFQDFAELVSHRDPDGKFSNLYLREVVGIRHPAEDRSASESP